MLMDRTQNWSKTSFIHRFGNCIHLPLRLQVGLGYLDVIAKGFGYCFWFIQYAMILSADLL